MSTSCSGELKIANASDPTTGLASIWERLEERYGAVESVYHLVLAKLQSFPKLGARDSAKLYDLCDILGEIQALKNNPVYSTAFSYFDSSVGVTPIVSKLPFNLQEKWVNVASRYKKSNNSAFPPLAEFTSFLKEQAKIKNDPSFISEPVQPQVQKRSTSVKVNKIDVNADNPGNQGHTSRYLSNADSLTRSTESFAGTKLYKCPIHKSNTHDLNDCKAFQVKTNEEKRKMLTDLKLCFKCLVATDHQSKRCPKGVVCAECGRNHATVMHLGTTQAHGGEPPKFSKNESITSKCTEVCGDVFGGKSCAKIVLVDVSYQNQSMRAYAILDDQSNKSLARPELFDKLQIKSNMYEYVLNSCSGSTVKQGRHADALTVQSIDGERQFELPTVIECHEIPDNREEIPTPKVARNQQHLTDIANEIPDLDEDAPILLLLGRDIPEVHHISEQRIGPKGTPFAQHTPLGWVVIGEVCLGDSHITSHVTVNKTFVVGDGRASLLPPCANKFKVNNVEQNECNSTYVIDNGRYTLFKPCTHDLDHMFSYDFVFGQNVRDNQASLSVEDQNFLSIMDKEFVLDASSRWSAPLPFKESRPSLPNNRAQAYQRAQTLQASLNKNPVKKKHFVDFMGRLLENGHAEIAPPLQDGVECWYLPIFGVYHPKKPAKIRVVFDSAAQFGGLSLNSVLLQGPDLTNSLLGVLLRFRREVVAVSVDIEQMFFCFGVRESDRDYLRFFWHKDNDTEKPLVEYRMCKHVFGNSPSPAIANYGLKRSVEDADEDVKEFVQKDFYVDDGLTSCPSVGQAKDLVKRSQQSLAAKGIRLHKLTSNVAEVMQGFPEEDLAVDLSRLDFGLENLPTRRSLGLEWDLQQDCFLFSRQLQDKPVTKRGILSTINSVFDPIGFLGPVIIEGRWILRDVVSSGLSWDEPVSAEMQLRWHTWVSSLDHLPSVTVPRSLFKVSLSEVDDLELHVFCDASQKAIAAVAYVVGNIDGTTTPSFVLGKVKVAPSKGHTIPRLELCAAVLATEIYTLVEENLCVDFKQVKFYTDSKVVLGYINNQSRRFYTYISNRVQKIRHVSSPQQWRYVPTTQNPADVGTRGSGPSQLTESMWLLGPAFLVKENDQVPEFYPLVEPDLDSEVRPLDVVTLATKVGKPTHLGCARFERFSSWDKLVMALCVLLHIMMSYKKGLDCKGWHLCHRRIVPEDKLLAQVVVLREVQYESYKTEVDALTHQKALNRTSSLLSLDPFLDDHGLLRVGGRLQNSSLPFDEKHPIILPAKHHVSCLVIRHFHESVQHQGRSYTEGAVRQAGYWIVGGKRAVSSLIFNCVTCKKLRGKFEGQKMSDLPEDRVEQAAPFSYVGVDVFGPWQVVSRKTRSSQASSKRWAVLFTCLSIRAVHIEVIDEMSSSAFINALRRLIAIRGRVKVFRSDRGTNFVGATDHIGVQAVNVEDERTKSFLERSGSVWVFNAPHSSHMGGSWERIGLARRILDPMLANIHNLTHDVLVTFMHEVSAIINARPIVPVSTDPSCPDVLSPSALLNMKLQCDQVPIADLSIQNLYKDQWRRVQYLAEQFWLRWRKEFLQQLQTRSKWHFDQNPIGVDDIVLLKDHELARNSWPMGRVSKVFPSSDGKIRKVEICVFRGGKQTFLIRPVVELVLLVKC